MVTEVLGDYLPVRDVAAKLAEGQSSIFMREGMNSEVLALTFLE